MNTKEITESLEDKWKRKVQITLTLEELQTIICSLHFLKERYEKDLEEAKSVVENDVSELVEDIKFTQSLHSDLVDTLYYETDK